MATITTRVPTLIGPFDVGYPIVFRSGGDTTREAFGKHIQEIERIYGILNSLDTGKLTTPDMILYLKEHINDTAPHPKWKIYFSDLYGELDGSKIVNSISKATIPAANVIGKLTNANIDANKINGLEEFINGLSGDSGEDNRGDGITESNLDNKGYVKFGNGLIVNWGVTTVGNMTKESSGNNVYQEYFTKSFSLQCYVVCCNIEVYTTPNQNYFNINYDGASYTKVYYIALGI